MKRLIEQTACEHGKWENCGDASNVNHRWVKCQGGTSKEVTVDYEAGAKAAYGVDSLTLTGHPTCWEDEADGVKSEYREVANAAVDAALAGDR